MKRILITGGAGFIGSNFIRYIIKSQKNFELLVNLDLLTYAGNLETLAPVMEEPNFRFIRADIATPAICLQKEMFGTGRWWRSFLKRMTLTRWSILRRRATWIGLSLNLNCF